MLERARKHQREFNSLIWGDDQPRLWSIEENQEKDGSYTYALFVDQSRLKELKPVVADLANNLVHALDQLVGALARLHGHERSHLYFPWALGDAKFQRCLEKLKPFIGDNSVQEILTARERQRFNLPHAQLVKEVSNSSKHWELVPSRASVMGIAVNRPGQPQQIWSVPDSDLDDYYYVFCNTTERMSGLPFQMLVGLRFFGLDSEIAASPDTIFDCAFRYVEDVIKSVCGPDDATEGPSEVAVTGN